MGDVDEAIACTRARWAGPALDPRDVAERLAVREEGAVGPSRFTTVTCPPAVRLFVRGGRRAWTSAYVLELAAVDRLLDRLLARSMEAR